ncbi:aldehyde dehydrogenase (NAD+) [Paenibacillus sophorae]|uniref:Aldehyde dehydrogenase n=1 Tax=Paenibacillus sophorae TaxID=1333845 RepID=A0A1H8PIL4_9BACL|nr:aldehyde dehydrogenase [Paenibacillus sophorae]QWU16583.1 aldehyde dehydrogenase [Paenibacillus sophorae]SEO41518.1 aldehyde dehydrogenase (NAD+) [Paenibacillus sophorae]
MVSYGRLIDRQRSFFASEATKELSYRIDALRRLKAGIQKHERQLINALKADLNKSEFEAYSTEIGIVLEEISFTLRHLRAWAKPRKVKTPITHFGTRGYIYSEPYGSALILAPWNYPFQLAAAPLIGAIAAGNCAVLKPSELTPRTSETIGEIIRTSFQEDYISVVQGGIETSEALLAEKFDYIFFTGSVPVGKIVMIAAAKHLTPVTLELGGKSPCIVHEDANLKLAARRIAWGKFMNAGQTCVAPDYIYVHQSVKDRFLSELESAVKELYGERPLLNPDYTRIVGRKHFDRLGAFLGNGTLAFGGGTDPERLTIEPTVLTDIGWEDPVMQEEIFGPVLPVLEYRHLSEAISRIRNQPRPLALYLFTESNSVQEEVRESVSFGGGCINDTVYHIVSPYLPFGGVGSSGMGAYHGQASFDTFSHSKSVMKQTTWFDLPFRYPNRKNGLKSIKRFLK